MLNRAAYRAQERYCKENRKVMLVPPDGDCLRCGEAIFSSMGGYSEREAGRKHITHCPHCGYAL